MSDRLGPVSYTSDSEVFIGRDYEKTKSYSEKVAGDIDDEVRGILRDAYGRCERILNENSDKLDAVAAFLLAHDTMNGPEFTAVMKDYILAERAYGIPEKRLLHRYLLKPSLIPTITVMAMDIASIFGNAFLVENLFNYPGLSRYGLSAMLNKDINAISGVVMVLGLIFIILNILSDLIVAWLDPRVRLMGGGEE